jgi:glycosyltransferase involved in cell wall biosynthesis
VQPSLAEGFGLPVVEAMSCGVPVVCSDNSSLVEVGAGVAVLVKPTAEGLSAGVSEVLGWSERERAATVKKGLARAKEFSWQKVAEEMGAIYGEVAAG